VELRFAIKVKININIAVTITNNFVDANNFINVLNTAE
jgi:hypothetical protein